VKTAFGIGLLAAAAVSVLWAQQDFRSAQVLPIDPARELAMKIPGSFTFASVGDLIIMRPTSNYADPAFQSAIKIVKDADLAFGNFEGSLADFEHFDGPRRGFLGTEEVAADVKAMGFDILNRANNHLLDSELEGMFSTNMLLEKAGLVHAGTGRHLEEARAAKYVDLPKGRAGLVGIHTPLGPGALPATARFGNVGGRAGLNALGLTVSFVVTPAELEALRTIRNSAYEAGKHINHAVEMPLKDATADSLLMFGIRYKSSGQPGTKSYAMNPNDLNGILRSVRNGKMFGDFMVATIHAHQGPWVAQRWAYEDEPPDFLVELARHTIDNGADVFVGHGPHVIRGIEIYKGKPIFYGLGEFFRQMELTVTYNPDPAATKTDVELLKQNWERGDTRAPIMYESLLAESRYQDGRLVEVRLHPIDAQYDAPISRTGVPRLASPELGRRILQRVQTLSKPFGTTIAIEGNIGIIRIPPQQTNASFQ
jgi:poly-gamma-glutamate synthesis protein (capsule biosynthesis protein)